MSGVTGNATAIIKCGQIYDDGVQDVRSLAAFTFSVGVPVDNKTQVTTHVFGSASPTCNEDNNQCGKRAEIRRWR